MSVLVNKKAIILVLSLLALYQATAQTITYGENASFHLLPSNQFKIFRDTSPTDISFNTLGTQMYVSGSGRDAIHQYSLEYPFDLNSNITYKGSLPVGENPSAIVFTEEGTKLFVCASDNIIEQYQLAEPFDVLTATLVFELNVSQESLKRASGIAFSSNGDKLFISDDYYSDSSSFHEFRLSENFELSGAEFQLSSESQTSFVSLDFVEGGNVLFANSGSTMYQYKLSYPYDISDMVLVSNEFKSNGVHVNDHKLYSINSASRTISIFEINYDSHVFIEKPSNDGSLDGEVELRIDHTAFSNAGGELTSPEHFVIHNLPPGLTPKLSVSESGHFSELILEGQALNHGDNGNITNLLFSFKEAAFETPTNVEVVNSIDYLSTISITFQNPTLQIEASESGFTIEDNFEISFSFDDQVQGFELDKVDVSNAKLSNLETIGDSIFKVQITPLVSLDSVSVYLPENAVFDQYGNGNMASNLVNLFYMEPLEPENQIFYGNQYNMGGRTNEQFLGLDIRTSCFAFNADGSKLLTDNDQYYMEETYDLTSFIGHQGTSPVGNNCVDLAFAAEGELLYTLYNRKVQQYRLNVPFDVLSGHEFIGSTTFDAVPSYSSISGFHVNLDGSKIYLLPSNRELILEYTFTDSEDITLGKTFNKSTYIGSLVESPKDITFNDLGDEMFILDQRSVPYSVSSYKLEEPYAISIANPLAKIGITREGDDFFLPNCIAFNHDGSRLFVSDRYAIKQIDLVRRTEHFVESSENTGEVTGEVTVNLVGDEFVNNGGVLTSPEHFVLDPLPSGLTPELYVSESGKSASLILTGNSITHSINESIKNIDISFSDIAFKSGNSDGLPNSQNATLDTEIQFINPGIKISTFEENPTDNTHIFFEIEFSSDMIGFSETDIVVDHGTVIDFQQLSPSNFEIEVVVERVGYMTVTVADGVATDSLGNENTGGETSICYHYCDGAPNLEYSETIFIELEGDDGALDGEAKIVLTGDSFTNLSGELSSPLHFGIENLPDGLVPEVSISEDGSQATLRLNGNANSHDGTDDVESLRINFTDEAFTLSDASDIELSGNYDSPIGISFSKFEVSITTTEEQPISTNLFTVDITFGKEVLEFEIDNIEVKNALISNLSTNDNISYTIEVVPTDNSFITLEIESEVVSDLSGNNFNAPSNLLSLNISSPAISYGKSYNLLQDNIDFIISDSTFSSDSEITDFCFKNNGNTLFTLSTDDKIVRQFVTNIPYESQNAELVGSFDLSDLDYHIYGISFSNDGLHMYLSGNVRFNHINPDKAVFHYSLEVPYQINSGVEFIDSIDIYSSLGAYGSKLLATTINTTGNKFYVLDAFKNLTEYSLDSSFNLSSAISNTEYDINISETIKDLVKGYDDEKMFLLSYDNDTTIVYSFNMDSIDIPNQTIAVENELSLGHVLIESFDFNNLGTSLYGLATQSGELREYNLPLDAGGFQESSDNNGVLIGESLIYLSNETFTNTGGQLTSPDHFEIANLPSGLNAVLNVAETGNIAALQLSGNAALHANTNDVSDLNFQFKNEAFLTLNANQIIGSSIEESGIAIEFDNPDVKITSLNADTSFFRKIDFRIMFSEAMENFESSDLLISNADIVEFTTEDHRVFEVSVLAISEGEVHMNLPDSVCTDHNGNFNLGSDITIYFYQPSISYSEESENFLESIINHGEVIGSFYVFAHGVEFSSSNGILTEGVDYSIENLPIGLTSNMIVNDDADSARLEISGQADRHGSVQSIGNLILNFTNSAFQDIEVSEIINASNSISNVGIEFLDPTCSIVTDSKVITQKEFTITVNFSEEMPAFEASHIQLYNAHITNFSNTANKSFEIELEAELEGLVSIQILENEVVDAEGNPNMTSDKMVLSYVQPSMQYGQFFDFLNTDYEFVHGTAFDDNKGQNLQFNADGTAVFTIGGGYLEQYSLNDPYDLSSGMTLETSIVRSRSSLEMDLSFSPDGSQLILPQNQTITRVGIKVFQKQLATPFDIGSEWIDVGSLSENLYSFDGGLVTYHFSNDGTTAFFTSKDFGSIFQINLSTPFSIHSEVEYIGIFDSNIYYRGDLAFNNNGTEMYIIDGYNRDVIKFNLSEPFDLITGTVTKDSTFALSNWLGSSSLRPNGITFSPTGEKMYVTDLEGSIFQFNRNEGKSTFVESKIGDGSVTGSATIYAVNTKFTLEDTILTSPEHFSIDNLPTGLIPTMEVLDNGNKIHLMLSGHAVSQNVSDNVDDLIISFTDQAFHEENANLINHSVNAHSGFSIEFINEDLISPELVISTDNLRTTIEPIPVIISFTEEVIGFTAEDVIVNNGEIVEFTTTDNIIYNLSIKPNSDGIVDLNVLTASCTDLFGNENLAADQLTIAVDLTHPKPVIISDFLNLSNASTIDIDIDFNETVVDFDKTDITLDNASVSDFEDNENGVFGVTLVPELDGEITLSIDKYICEDEFGNGNEASEVFNLFIDRKAPNVTISSTLTSTTQNTSIPISVKFDEEVIGFEQNDLIIENATVVSFIENSNSQFEVILDVKNSNLITVNIASGAAQDLAGNNNLVADEFSINYESFVLEKESYEDLNLKVLFATQNSIAITYKVGSFDYEIFDLKGLSIGKGNVFINEINHTSIEVQLQTNRIYFLKIDNNYKKFIVVY